MRSEWHNEPPPQDDGPTWLLLVIVGPVFALFLILIACVAALAVHGTWNTITGPDTPAEQETR